MAPEPNDKHEISTSLTKLTHDGAQENVEGTADKSKTPRHSRWTRHETLVLIEGKKAAEERGRKGRRSGSGYLDPLQPKWDSVSSYCKNRGVNRGPVQCRKRWSNLVGDFRKIKTWEDMESSVKEERESFWMMRNDLRRENKLPGFFDKEVFDVLDGRAFTTAAYQLALVTVSARPKEEEDEEVIVMEEDEEEEDGEGEIAIFDSGRQAVSAEEALFLDSEQSVQEEKQKSPDKETTIHSPVPISEKHYQPFHQVHANQGIAQGKQPGLHFWQGSKSQEGCKRRRISTDATKDTNLEDQLINVLEKNAIMLNSQLEAHNTNLQLDRDQRKDHTDSLIDALKKVTDALVKIADKLTKDT